MGTETSAETSCVGLLNTPQTMDNIQYNADKLTFLCLHVKMFASSWKYRKNSMTFGDVLMIRVTDDFYTRESNVYLYRNHVAENM
jgi:hypothetical protein